MDAQSRLAEMRIFVKGKSSGFKAASLLIAAGVVAIAITGCLATEKKPDEESGVRLDSGAGFYGVNFGGGLFSEDRSWGPDPAVSGSEYSFQTSLKIVSTGSDRASAGIYFGGDGQSGGYYFGLFPNGGWWRLRDLASMKTIAEGYEGSGIATGRWHTIKINASASGTDIFLDGAWKTSAPPAAADAAAGPGLRIRESETLFDDILFGTVVSPFNCDFSVGDCGWQGGERLAWERVETDGGNGAWRGSTLLGAEALLDGGLSPLMDRRLDLLQEAGIRRIRVFFNWSDIQAEGRDAYYWDRSDAVVRAARGHGMEVVPVLAYAPVWAVAPEFRGDIAAYAFPPVDPGDYGTFVREVVNRYRPGGILAREQDWDGGYGITRYELGHEFNAGKIFRQDGSLFFAGWMGSLGQYVDMLKAGRDAVKSICPDCLVLNGAAADAVPPAYPTSRHDYLVWRQSVWQGVEDLYAEIQARHPDDPAAADRYFDVLNIHTYEWFMLSAQGQMPDGYRSYTFPDRQWYRDRLENVSRVMTAYGDDGKPIWLTETGFASADNGDPFAGHLDEPGQAQALRMAYDEAAGHPEVEAVLWWFSHDIDSYVGLIRRDVSTKPSWHELDKLTNENGLPDG